MCAHETGTRRTASVQWDRGHDTAPATAGDPRFPYVETKVEAGAPEQTAPREQFVRVAVREIRKAGFLGRVTIQSFDWGALMRMRQVEPRLPLVALTNYDFPRTGGEQ